MLNANAARTEQIVSALLKKGFDQAMLENGAGTRDGPEVAPAPLDRDNSEEEMRVQDLLRFSRIWDGVSEDGDENTEL